MRTTLQKSRCAYYENNTPKVKTRYHSQKGVKLDACEKLREQDPRGRKVLSRSAIKKTIHSKLRFGKNHVDVQNSEGKSSGSRCQTQDTLGCILPSTTRVASDSHQTRCDGAFLREGSLDFEGLCIFIFLCLHQSDWRQVSALNALEKWT
jgi:hypothetical protein